MLITIPELTAGGMLLKQQGGHDHREHRSGPQQQRGKSRRHTEGKGEVEEANWPRLRKAPINRTLRHPIAGNG
jgi:hypothetical protein